MKFHPEKPLHFPKSSIFLEIQRISFGFLKKITPEIKSNTILKILVLQKYFDQAKIVAKCFRQFVSKYGKLFLAELLLFIEKTRCLGFTNSMSDYERSKLGIFNQINLFQICTGIIAPFVVILTNNNITVVSSIVLLTPSMTSLLVLYLNSRFKTEFALLAYFILYPFFTSLAYMGGMDLGVDLFFVLYGILAVFFLKDIGYIAFCIGFSMVNYFMLAVVLKFFRYNLENDHPFFYMLNHVFAIGFIFYGLYLIKKENTQYQASLITKNVELQEMNAEVKAQKEKVAEKVQLLEEQAIQLNEVDKFKNRLFSIVSHDLKNPMYALRNLFTEMQQNRIPVSDMKKMIPHILRDINNTTGLMDNLLHWAKSQMNAGTVTPQIFNITELVKEIIQQHRLQADLKALQVNLQLSKPLHIYADRDMISLVIRNFLSNAIKFTPENGSIELGTNQMDDHLEIFVTDSGAGMDAETLAKLRSNNYFSTKGTSNEPGTGLGLMLCREFLQKNSGQMHIESEPGVGSTFSFTLPLAD